MIIPPRQNDEVPVYDDCKLLKLLSANTRGYARCWNLYGFLEGSKERTNAP